MPAPPQVDTVRNRLEHLVRSHVQGRMTDLVTFVDHLLTLAGETGQIRCTQSADKFLRFEVPGQGPYEIAVNRAKGKVRMMCARLAYLCHESGGEFFPYGGEGFIERAPTGDASVGGARKWHVIHHNTPDRQDFTITAVEGTPTRAR